MISPNLFFESHHPYPQSISTLKLLKLDYIGRIPLAAPAVGISARHKVEQESVLKATFAPL